MFVLLSQPSHYFMFPSTCHLAFHRHWSLKAAKYSICNFAVRLTAFGCQRACKLSSNIDLFCSYIVAHHWIISTMSNHDNKQCGNVCVLGCTYSDSSRNPQKANKPTQWCWCPQLGIEHWNLQNVISWSLILYMLNFDSQVFSVVDCRSIALMNT